MEELASDELGVGGLASYLLLVSSKDNILRTVECLSVLGVALHGS